MHMRLADPTPDILSVVPLGDGREAIVATLRLMRKLVREYKSHPMIRDTTRELTAFLPGKDWAAEAQLILDWVRNNIRYVLDTNGQELLHSPVKLLEKQAGDCDDMATLAAAMLESIGHPTRFVACGFVPGDLSHVFVETRIGGSWVALDPTENGPLGWSPPGQCERYVFHVR